MRQKQVLEFIVQFIIDNGWAPTLREIGAGVGIRSVNGVAEMLDRLEDKGCIRRGRGARTIVINAGAL